EPWLTPDRFVERHVHAVFVDDPELKLARVNRGRIEGRSSIFDFHFLVGTPDGVDHFVETHELALFTHGEYLEAFRAAGLEPDYDDEGLMGRGLYVGSS